MAFPDTRLSLIRRIVVTGDAASWDQFVASYWQATCRFAIRLGNLQWTDAEDVASKVFEILYRKSLLESWLAQPNARFKTLLCTLIRNVVRNAVRARQTAARHIGPQPQMETDLSHPPTNVELDLFYSIWAEELLKAAVQSVMADYHREGKGDYFRILHARLCDEMPVKEIAAELQIKVTDVDNYFRHARQRLADRIDLMLRKEVACYTDFAGIDAEFQHERQRLADLLKQQGGLDAAVRNCMLSKEL